LMVHTVYTKLIKYLINASTTGICICCLSQRCSNYCYSAPLGERSIAISLSVSVCVSLSASISLELLDRSSRIFFVQIPVAVARSSSGGVAICYVLPVLWMT